MTGGMPECQRCHKRFLKSSMDPEGLCLRCHAITRDLSSEMATIKVPQRVCFYCANPIKVGSAFGVKPFHRECRKQELARVMEEKKSQRAKDIEMEVIPPRICRECNKPFVWTHGSQLYHQECKQERDRRHARESKRRERAKKKDASDAQEPKD